MVGSRSGRLSYLVATEGGVAGVGERLRRIDWSEAEFNGDMVRVPLDPASFARLPELAMDNWPAQ